MFKQMVSYGVISLISFGVGFVTGTRYDLNLADENGKKKVVIAKRKLHDLDSDEDTEVEVETIPQEEVDMIAEEVAETNFDSLIDEPGVEGIKYADNDCEAMAQD